MRVQYKHNLEENVGQVQRIRQVAGHLEDNQLRTNLQDFGALLPTFIHGINLLLAGVSPTLADVAFDPVQL